MMMSYLRFNTKSLARPGKGGSISFNGMIRKMRAIRLFYKLAVQTPGVCPISVSQAPSPLVAVTPMTRLLLVRIRIFVWIRTLNSSCWNFFQAACNIPACMSKVDAGSQH